MPQACTLIFDIGKTNKKWFLFDEDFQVIDSSSVVFKETEDDDSFPSDDLSAIVDWIREQTSQIAADPQYDLRKLNFSTYGASLVHLDKNDTVATPFYNYLKSIPQDLYFDFYNKYGSELDWSMQTSSPSLGMLNSGLQLYYLKYQKPQLFNQVNKSLHFPQYLSHIFTNRMYTEYTSLGCHTGMWDFQKQDYTTWMHKEGFVELFGQLKDSGESILQDLYGKQVGVGMGIHDSSSALIPYIRSLNDPFILISTGTWSICLNPFSKEALSEEELKADSLQFLNPEGEPVKASRLFLGKHFEDTINTLSDIYNVSNQYYRNIYLNKDININRYPEYTLMFDHGLLQPNRFGYVNKDHPDYELFGNFNDAYFQFMNELTDLQITSMQMVLGKVKINQVIVDGGFSSNQVFMQMLASKLQKNEVYSAETAIGSALGAAMVMENKKLPTQFIQDYYKLKLYSSSI